MRSARPKAGPATHRAGLALLLLPWTLMGMGSGCLGAGSPPPSPVCPPSSVVTPASSGTNEYVYDWPDELVDALGVDWLGQPQSSYGVALEGEAQGCIQGGRITGPLDPSSPWETYHLTAAVSVRGQSQPMRVMSMHLRNYGDGVSIEPYVPCPNGSSTPWLYVRANHLEDIHDDAIESDGLCAVEIADNLIERSFVAFGFRNRTSDPNRWGPLNTVRIEGNLVRMHAFANNYNGETEHGAIWKWAHEGRGPRIAVRNNRFLAFDAPGRGGLFPYVTRVTSCENNVLLFAGTQAEWAAALAGGCDDDGDDGLCEGERLLALAGCYTVITKPDTQSEADFLATHWDPWVAAWKSSHSADDE